MPLPIERVMDDSDMESCLNLIDKSIESARRIVVLADGAVKTTTLARARSLLADLEAERHDLAVRLGWAA